MPCDKLPQEQDLFDVKASDFTKQMFFVISFRHCFRSFWPGQLCPSRKAPLAAHRTNICHKANPWDAKTEASITLGCMENKLHREHERSFTETQDMFL